MARLVGVDLPREKRLEVALTYIYGVGRTRAQETLTATGISPDLRVRDLLGTPPSADADQDLKRCSERLDQYAERVYALVASPPTDDRGDTRS